MKITSLWRRNKNPKEKKRIIRKPKIAWKQLGLENPDPEGASMSIDEIRRQVIQLSSWGLGQGVRSRPRVEGTQTSDASKHAEPSRKRRQGATE